MTFDQFKALALNPPVKEMDRIFVLEHVTVDELDGVRRQHYPSYEVRCMSRVSAGRWRRLRR